MLWEFDTNREFTTVNGVPAKGASINGPGPAVAGGMLFINSGYGALGGRPGQRAARVRARIAVSRAALLLLVKCPAPRRRNGPPSTENSSVMSNALSERIENTRRS